MTKDQDFKLLFKIQTYVLKVNLHCDGCKQEVRKVLQRTEGVYTVDIDAENQKVTVSGSVDSATLIKKLARAGKHAEIWTAQKQKPPGSIKEDKKNSHSHNNSSNKNKGDGGTGGQKQNQSQVLKNLEALKNQRAFLHDYEDDGDDYSDGDFGEYEDELQFLRDKAAKQMVLLRQQESDPSKKGAANAGSTNNGNIVNVGKKGNPNQSINPKAMAAPKMNAGHYGNGLNATTMGLPNVGGNTNPKFTDGFQAESGVGGGLFSAATQPNNGVGYPNMYGNGVNPAQMMIGANHAQQMQGRYPHAPQLLQQAVVQPAQMMYHRSPFAPSATTGYYYGGYGAAPYGYYGGDGSCYHGGSGATAHMFNDDNTCSCSIM